jgi:hypothetical protein
MTARILHPKVDLNEPLARSFWVEFTEFNGNKIGRIANDGTVTEVRTATCGLPNSPAAKSARCKRIELGPAREWREKRHASKRMTARTPYARKRN